jgi:DNA-binding transcriptional LysR family regulator
MDLEHLRAFVKVVRLGSLTKAAAAMGVPKSTVSRRLAELEQQLGTSLVQRTTRRLSVTDAGYRLFEQTEPHLLELEAAARGISDGNGELGGTLRLTTPANLTSISLIPLIQDFMVLHPKVKIVVLATNRRVDLVAEGVDIALRAGTLQPSSLIARRLMGGECRLFASETYLRKRGTPKQLSDLAHHDCLAFSEDQPQEKWVLHSVAKPHKTQEVVVQARFATTDYTALTRACALDMGIALLPNQVLSREGHTPGLRRVLPQWKGKDSVFHVVYPAARQVSPAVRAFVDYVVEAVPRLFAQCP